MPDVHRDDRPSTLMWGKSEENFRPLGNFILASGRFVTCLDAEQECIMLVTGKSALPIRLGAAIKFVKYLGTVRPGA
jgi:hypothetical protein